MPATHNDAAPAKEIFVNAFYSASPSQSWPGLWSHPQAHDLDYNRLDYWVNLARICEDGLIDGIFLADILAVHDVYQGSSDATLKSGCFCPTNDPMLLIPAMAAVTDHLTFGVTGNTTFEPPYLLARRLSTLDHLTEGRLAWNVVTGTAASAARALGRTDLPPHDERYDIADEFMEVVYKLWETSWDSDAAVRDKDSHIFADPSKVRPVRHAGRYFQCEGIHLSEPSPQRTPFIFSAGASGRGMRFAGRHAESAFISANSIPYARHLTDSLRGQAEACGRNGQDLKVFNAVTVIVAETDALAQEIMAETGRYSSADGNLAFLSGITGIDLSRYAPDEPIRHVESQAIQSIVEQMTRNSEGRVYTVADLAKFGPLRGPELFFCGSARTVCDQIETFVAQTGIDGLNLVRTVEPAGIRSFCDLVVPELQNRGLFKTAYRPGTMRQKMFPGRTPGVLASHPAAQV
ncbi:LLM class flavin-dependent oxidoreductase (plasmid) [Tistrella bauzanensis]|uniref:LLM class flavin-dependent oxidoreductase n=1 Tax=Tistrella TaxID=171436 RepID=UPI0031F6D0D6